MTPPTSDDIRRALASYLEATARVDEIHEEELPVESTADAAVAEEGRRRDALLDLVRRFAGDPPPRALDVDGMLITLDDHGDGMAVVPAGRTVKL
jgi:hypothetical protein